MLTENITFPDSTPFRVGQDEDGNYGVILPIGEDGADTVIPFGGSDFTSAKYIYQRIQSNLGDVTPAYTYTNKTDHDQVICLMAATGTAQSGRYAHTSPRTNGEMLVYANTNTASNVCNTAMIIAKLKPGEYVTDGVTSYSTGYRLNQSTIVFELI